jgi:hypothetical protein
MLPVSLDCPFLLAPSGFSKFIQLHCFGVAASAVITPHELSYFNMRYEQRILKTNIP